MKEIISCNMLLADAGSVNIGTGDYGHGARSVIYLKDLGSTCWGIKLLKNDKVVYHSANAEGGFDELVLTLGGTTEHQTIIEALEYIVEKLKKTNDTQAHRVQDLIAVAMEE